MGSRTIASIGQLTAGAAALGLAYWQYTKQTPATNPIFLSIFFLFSAALVIDKIPLIFSNHALEKDEAERKVQFDSQRSELNRRLDLLPAYFAGIHDVISFPSDAEGTRYLVANCPLAIGIKNTVLRYSKGITNDLDDGSEFYSEWLRLKEETVTKHKCHWTEIVSEQLRLSGSVVKLSVPECSGFYEARFLEQDHAPMVQMTIIEYRSGYKEIVFGLQFPGLAHGPCFLTKNEKIVQYFDSYFDHFFSLAKP